MVWYLWNSGYDLKSGYWYGQSSQASTSESNNLNNKFAIVFQAIVGVTLWLITIFKAISSSSISSLWLMINQLQIFFLLLLTRAYIPDDVQQAIVGAKFTLNLPNVIPFKIIDLYNSEIGYFNFELSNSSLYSFSIDSDSSIYNLSSFIMLQILIMLFHILICLLYKLSLSWNEDRRWSKIVKTIKYVLNKSFKVLTFSYYIRSLLEMAQYILVSSTYEIYWFNTSDNKRIISLAFALFTMLLFILMLVFILYLTFSSFRADENNHNMLSEFFEGLKPNSKFRLYSSLMLIRKSFFIIWLIWIDGISSKIIIGVLSFIQLLYMIYVIYFRPYKEIKCNAIDIMNELFFFVLLGILIFLNSKNDWNTITTYAFISSLVSNNILIFILVLGKLMFYTIVDKIKVLIVWLWIKWSRVKVILLLFILFTFVN